MTLCDTASIVVAKCLPEVLEQERWYGPSAFRSGHNETRLVGTADRDASRIAGLTEHALPSSGDEPCDER